MATRDTHVHRMFIIRATGAFDRCVNPKAHNLSAHGGELQLEECRCGAVRYCNRRGRHKECTEWVVAYVHCTHCGGRGLRVDAGEGARVLQDVLAGKMPPRRRPGRRFSAAALRAVRSRSA